MKKLLNNRIIQLVGVLIAGLILGSLFFSGNRNSESEKAPEAGQESTWTCSMHPQIRQDEPGKCPLCGMDLIPVSRQGGQGSEESPFVHSMSPEAVALANVQTMKVQFAAPEHEILVTGKIAVNERKLAAITADYSGRIEKLFVNFTGQQIRKGQRIATIYSPELITAQKELLELAKNKSGNPALYNAARERLLLWKVTESQVDALEAAGEVMTEITIYADMTGIVLNRAVSTGDYVSKGNILFEIVDLSTVWVLLDAYESDLPWIKIGQKVTFSLASVPGKEFTSTILFVDPLINPQTRTISVRAEAPNPGSVLKPEMFVHAKIKSKVSHMNKSLIIPKTSVLWTGKRSVVYVKVPGSEYPAFELREIELGPPAGDFQVVERGLQEGEEVVTNGVFAIDAAAQLSGNFSMMNRPVSKRLTVSNEFKSLITDFTRQYFALKNALVESDFAKAKKTAGTLQRSFLKIDMDLLQDQQAHHFWMEQDKLLRKSLELLLESENIEEQRTHFSTLSDIVIRVAEDAGLTIEVVYVAHCPMAFGDKGAYWLSEFPEIKNPYYGDAMLECGEVRKRIRSIDSYEEAGQQVQPPQEHQH